MRARSLQGLSGERFGGAESEERQRLRAGRCTCHKPPLNEVPEARGGQRNSTINYFCVLLLFSRSVRSNSVTSRAAAEIQASLSFIISRSLLKLMSIESVMGSNHFCIK